MRRKSGFTVVEILIYMVILAMFFMAANIGYNSFIARKRTEMVARKVEALFVKARGLSFSPTTKPDICLNIPIDGYYVAVGLTSVTMYVKCGIHVNPDLEPTLKIETYTFENSIVASGTTTVGYKPLGHGLDVVLDFFGTPSNYIINFNRSGSTTNGVTLTISPSGEIVVTTQ